MAGVGQRVLMIGGAGPRDPRVYGEELRKATDSSSNQRLSESHGSTTCSAVGCCGHARRGHRLAGIGKTQLGLNSPMPGPSGVLARHRFDEQPRRLPASRQYARRMFNWRLDAARHQSPQPMVLQLAAVA